MHICVHSNHFNGIRSWAAIETTSNKKQNEERDKRAKQEQQMNCYCITQVFMWEIEIDFQVYFVCLDVSSVLIAHSIDINTISCGQLN